MHGSVDTSTRREDPTDLAESRKRRNRNEVVPTSRSMSNDKSHGSAWRLIRIWHVETISTAAHLANAPLFSRTSYCIVPSAWLQLGEPAQFDRILFALDLAYDKRNYVSSRSGDPAQMWWVAVGFELVNDKAMPGWAPDDDGERVMVRREGVHPALIDAAAARVIDAWRVDRAGIDTKPWTEAFTAIRFEEDGVTCHLVGFRDRASLFEATFAGSAAA